MIDLVRDLLEKLECHHVHLWVTAGLGDLVRVHLDLELQLYGGEETLGLALFGLFLLSQLLLGLGLLEGVGGAHDLAGYLLLNKLLLFVNFVDLLSASVNDRVRVVLRRVCEGRLLALGWLLLRLVVVVLEDASEAAVDVVGLVRGVLALADDFQFQ